MKEDIISRRRFFRRAASAALPFLAASFVGPWLMSCDDSNDDLRDALDNENGGGGCTSCSNGSYNNGGGCTSCANGSYNSGGCSGSSCSKNCANSSNGTSSDNPSNADGIIGGHGYIDLGISTKWALYNLGADSVSDMGNTYKAAISGGTDNSAVLNTIFGACGDVRGKDFSGSSVDNATKEWGQYWRTPTKEEVAELRKAVTVKSFTYNNKKGYLIKSKKNNKSIFLFDKEYWTSSVSTYMARSGEVFQSSLYTDGEYLDRHHYIRPVTDLKSVPGGCTGSSCTSNCANNSNNSGGCRGSSCTNSCEDDCNFGCYGRCQAVCSSCSGKCQNGCISSCQFRAEAGCGTGCTGTCNLTCSDTCKMHCYSSCKLIGKF